MELRWYQKEALDAAMQIIDKKEPPSVIAMPTGSGKTPTLSAVIEAFLEKYGKRVLVLSHVDKILLQNKATLTQFLGDIVGVYSASLNTRDTDKLVTVGGIQSVYRNIQSFYDAGLIVIDECHLVNSEQKGMYRSALKKFQDYNWHHVPVLGFTATPYRTGQGWIHTGKETLFKSISYNCCDFDQYNKLVEEGYLSKMYTRATDLEINVDNVKKVAGDFNLKELSQTVDREEITQSAVEETIQFGKKYKKWLIFAIDIAHAEHIKKELLARDIPTCCVHSQMSENRNVVLDDYKKGKYRACVNVDVLTTGFDEPSIDLIAMMRPTLSPIIHVQTAGRGARISDKKDHCLFLDFAGNTERLGPMNNIEIKEKGKKKGNLPMAKKCPECGCLEHPKVKLCSACGHEFKFKEKLQSSAGNTEILQTQKQFWVNVNRISYSIHQKKGKPDSLRVAYHSGLRTYYQYICYGRPDYAGKLAYHWVRTRYKKNGKRLPGSVADLYAGAHRLLRAPKRIKIDASGKYANVIDADF